MLADHNGIAAFNEKLLLANGMAVAPIDGLENQGQKHRSLRELVSLIDNAKDFQRYLMAFHPKIPVRGTEVKYIPHGVSHSLLENCSIRSG